jgi:two-component system, OmpR family, phosphate regulon sensor histidine kinase PhoR
MKISSKRVWLMVAVIVAALSGLVLVQAILLQNALESKDQAFKRNVTEALDQVVKKLETHEALRQTIHVIDTSQLHIKAGAFTSLNSQCSPDSIKPSAIMFSCDSNMIPRSPIELNGDTILYNVDKMQHITITSINPDLGTSQTIVDTIRNPGQYKICVGSDTSSQKIYRYSTDSLSFILHNNIKSNAQLHTNIVVKDQKTKIVQNVLLQLMTIESKPIETRIDPSQLDSLISSSLFEKGVDLKYAFGVYDTRRDTMPIAEPSNLITQLRSSEFKTRLFPSDFFSMPSELMLYFPNRQTYLWQQMVPILSATILFMAVVVFCFMYAVRVIVRQRRFTGRMIDFINNMTHEFKTPISTVALASEAIARPEVVTDIGKIQKFNKMIWDEMVRMRTQVDKILQMAVLEEGDYDLSLTEIDVHSIIKKAVENISLHVEERSGIISCHLNAENPIINADKVHVSNIIDNLLDNANKYSPNHPDISISTSNKNDGVCIEVSDKGVGLSEENKKYVFDKYYRVSSGNIHNVKGFGLGLSYVKLLMQAHGGNTKLESELGKGTTITLFFPSRGPEEGEK